MTAKLLRKAITYDSPRKRKESREVREGAGKRFGLKRTAGAGSSHGLLKSSAYEKGGRYLMGTSVFEPSGLLTEKKFIMFLSVNEYPRRPSFVFLGQHCQLLLHAEASEIQVQNPEPFHETPKT